LVCYPDGSSPWAANYGAARQNQVDTGGRVYIGFMTLNPPLKIRRNF
jgi:hypothetical protein